MARIKYFNTTTQQWEYADKAGISHNHDELYASKEYVTNATESLKNELLNGAGAAYDTLKELGDLIDENTDALDALEAVAASKSQVQIITWEADD